MFMSWEKNISSYQNKQSKGLRMGMCMVSWGTEETIMTWVRTAGGEDRSWRSKSFKFLDLLVRTLDLTESDLKS